MTAARQPSVLVIGAGFGGIGAAIALRREGVTDLTILERADDLGGVWRENTYPGAACDVPSPLYSYSFEPKPDWPQRYSGRAAIHDYLRGVAERHDLLDAIRFGAEVTEAAFDEHSGKWTAHTADGRTRVADVLISAVGQLSRPAWPAIPGRDTFAGPSFHSAEWDHEVELAGKRVACIGTGASAVQFIPEIQPKVGRLTVFQRTPAWVIPKFDTDYSPIQHKLFAKVPGALSVERLGWWSIGEFVSLGLVEFPAIARVVSAIAARHLRKQVDDPELRAKLTPDYPIGCKRGLFSNDYYPALTQPNVRVETTPITEITPEGVRTEDSALHEVDVIIYGTGFKGTEFLWPMRIRGRGGRELADVWSEGAHAYYGIAVPEFPNLFLVYGPNTNLSAGSIIYMIESQARYIRQAVRLLAEHPGHHLEVRDEPERAFNTALQQRLDRTPWNFCTSWYRTASGRITNNWPGTVSSYRRRTRKLVRAHFALTRAA
ncbi:NAD(P)/FAD-dependent oxidoreductase [Nocardia puris]|uniref:Cation diffusion facilitator CzcD-associated flavoprotein CzcO n=1 Tax=Nocardia puris TaxID=208602 RepID=A0A366D9W8_9NOCA|nr:NAD(P)/FAD-dependent oxidoreductase [Nocardia puris]MBF6211678.1 NAD(P)/FAD-dependent oxidoreductase [Nocardia puris]MBF6365682.1 NAD(P)/FAD-dependent oxidoreductase [Nocardia puris]MBF6460676.1 NAD(P)/FAD-dependent oxidoreductase [Nocardia puris]RBO86852.1 cation diffusion facilitator CzcD-associated flavoprotein CzcO [Nocardia puris]